MPATAIACGHVDASGHLCKGCAYSLSMQTYVNTARKTLGLSEICVFAVGIAFALVRHRIVQVATK